MGDSITDSVPQGMDNPRLKPQDCVINDMSTGCDPCSPAVMPHVEPRELWRVDKGDLYNYALAQQSSPLANIELDRTFISNETYTVPYIKRQSQSAAKLISTLCDWFSAFTNGANLFKM